MPIWVVVLVFFGSVRCSDVPKTNPHESTPEVKRTFLKINLSKHSIVNTAPQKGQITSKYLKATTPLEIACVAGGISRASAFVLVAKPWTRVAKPWEDWWRVELIRRSRNPLRTSPARNMAAPPPLARSRIPPATQATLEKACELHLPWGHAYSTFAQLSHALYPIFVPAKVKLHSLLLNI